MSRTVVWVTFIGAVALAGCTPAWAFTRTGTARSRAGTCEVQLLTSMPGDGYTEIGILDQSEHGDIRNAGDFLSSVRSHVCSAGGDAIVARISDTGQYMGGRVLARR